PRRRRVAGPRACSLPDTAEGRGYKRTPLGGLGERGVARLLAARRAALPHPRRQADESARRVPADDPGGPRVVRAGTGREIRPPRAKGGARDDGPCRAIPTGG